MLMDKLLCEFYRKKIVMKGNFTLKSGETSEYYINCRKLYEYPDIMRMVCTELQKKIFKTDWVCGVPNGATPFATTLSLLTDMPLMLLRKEKKEHGLAREIEAEYKKGDGVILLEDVITTGSSLRKFEKMLVDVGLKVHMKICIINRGNVEGIESLIPINTVMSPSNILLPRMDKNIIWAADVGTMKALFADIEKYGPKISVLKLHIDTFSDYSIENLIRLQEYKQKFGFLIWEDRKFADIGNIMIKQIRNSVYSYQDWVDIFSIHGIVGFESIISVIEEDTRFKWILVGQLSSSNNLITPEYTEECKEIYNSHPNIVGMVCQEYLGPEFVHIVPGISKHVQTDNKGQSYSQMCDKSFADFFVVGRSISKFMN